MQPHPCKHDSIVRMDHAQQVGIALHVSTDVSYQMQVCQCNSVAALCYTSYSTISRPRLERKANRAKETQHLGGIAQAGLSPHNNCAELRSNYVGMPVITQLQSHTPVCHAPQLLTIHKSHMPGLQPVSLANMCDVHMQVKDVCIW